MVWLWFSRQSGSEKSHTNHSKSLIRIEVNSVVCDTNVSCLFTYDTNFSCLFTFDKIFSCLFTCDVQLFVYIWYEFQLLVYINRTDISCLLTFIIHMSAVCLWLAIESFYGVKVQMRQFWFIFKHCGTYWFLKLMTERRAVNKIEFCQVAKSHYSSWPFLAPCNVPTSVGGHSRWAPMHINDLWDQATFCTIPN